MRLIFVARILLPALLPCLAGCPSIARNGPELASSSKAVTPPGSYVLSSGCLPQFAIPVPEVTFISQAEDGESFVGPPMSESARCQVKAMEEGYFDATLMDFEEFVRAQEDPRWCWAACAETVSRFRGIRFMESRNSDGEAPSTQQAILADYFSTLNPSQGGNCPIIVRALCPDLEARLCDLGQATASITLQSMKSDDIVESILEGFPVVLGLSREGVGHAVVAYGVRARARRSGNLFQELLGEAETVVRNQRFALEAVRVFDPADGVGLTYLTASDLASDCKLIMNPSMAHDLLSKALKGSTDTRSDKLSASDVIEDLFR